MDKSVESDLPEVIWTLPIEKVKNDDGREEYIISLPPQMMKHAKLGHKDYLFWGKRGENCFEVRKATKEELNYFKVDISQKNTIRDSKNKKYNGHLY